MKEELSIIVNKKDEVIGYKPRQEITADDIYRVSALWIENSKGEILLAQRGFMKKNGPGKWGAAVAGTVEKGESYEDNIYKETQEEIGISGYALKKGENIFSQQHGRQFFCQYFYLQLDMNSDEFILEEGEVESVRWFKKQEIENMYIYNKDCFSSQDFIKYKLGL